MASTTLKNVKGGAEIVKTGHTKTTAYGANPDAKRRGPGGSVSNVDFK